MRAGPVPGLAGLRPSSARSHSAREAQGEDEGTCPLPSASTIVATGSVLVLAARAELLVLGSHPNSSRTTTSAASALVNMAQAPGIVTNRRPAGRPAALRTTTR